MASLLDTALLTLNMTMRGVVWQGEPYSMTVMDLPMPTIQNQTDAIVRLTSAGICGSDLHFYHGLFTVPGAEIPWTMGHEGVGYVVEVGDGVNALQVGDRVVVPDTADDGQLHRGFTPPSGEYFGNGLALGGTQAEYVRVPFADTNLMIIPESPSKTNTSMNNDLDWLMLSDIFNTGWMGLDFAGFQPGETVAVFGAGPVGLLCAYSAFLRGASKVYVVDSVPSRLQVAASIGATPISFNESDPVEQIMALEPRGVMRSVDCVGFEAVNAQIQTTQNIVLNNMVAVTARTGGLGGIGVWPASNTNTAAAPRAATVNTTMEFNYGQFWGKALSLRSGGVDVVPLTGMLGEMIALGKAKPGFVVSQQIGIEDAPDAYARFSRHEEQKVVIRFPWI
ncbi:putative alcohol dehydrogenase [Phlyctema vagabunda]|uniref:Alcohol dehydrogenase n=1 Tax=Phlyctema vagabunda TaxID=108571 RepID=A0ABR4P1S7_9HELO